MVSDVEIHASLIERPHRPWTAWHARLTVDGWSSIEIMNTHQEIDNRSLEMHRLVAKKIRENPELFQSAVDTLANWRAIVCESSQPYLREWETLFSQGCEAALKIAEEGSEKAAAMRQCSPFCGILTHQERFEFLNQWRAKP